MHGLYRPLVVKNSKNMQLVLCSYITYLRSSSSTSIKARCSSRQNRQQWIESLRWIKFSFRWGSEILFSLSNGIWAVSWCVFKKWNDSLNEVNSKLKKKKKKKLSIGPRDKNAFHSEIKGIKGQDVSYCMEWQDPDAEQGDVNTQKTHLYFGSWKIQICRVQTKSKCWKKIANWIQETGRQHTSEVTEEYNRRHI